MNTENFLTKEFVKTLLPERAIDSNKGTFGNVLNIAGSENYRGAAYLSTASVLKSGAGYVALASIEKVIALVSRLCPEAVFYSLKDKNSAIAKNEYKKILELIPKFKVLSLGCGLSSADKNQKEIEAFLKNLLTKIHDIKIPVIIDADGLNLIFKLNIEKLPQNVILTPHPQEASRLLRVDIKEIQNSRSKYAVQLAKKYNSIVVLKGNRTVITNGEKVYINQTGNSALAKAGTGDVLTGMISGFCAQGANPFDAAILAVYLHGLSGDLATKELSEYSVNASDIVKYIPLAIKKLSE